MKFLLLIIKNLLRNKRRTVLIFTSTATSFFLIATLQTILTELKNPPETSASLLRLIVRHHISMFNVLPAAYREKISAIKGVNGVVGSMYYGGIYKDPANNFANFAVDSDQFFKVYTDVALPEDQKRTFIEDRLGAIAGSNLAKRFNWKIGEKILLESRQWPVNVELTLRGIYEGGTDLGSILYFHYDYFNELIKDKLGAWDNTGVFMVRAQSPEEIASISNQIDSMFRNSSFPTKTETERAFTLNYLSMYGDVNLVITSIISVVIFTIILITANSTSMLIRERTKEIGLLKALGFKRSQVSALLMLESVSLSVGGAILGAFGSRLLYSSINMAQITGGFLQRFYVTPLTLITCLVIGLLIGIFSSGLQVWQASRLTIIEALRRVT